MFYSQHGEDKWIAESLNPPPGVFVEVGASDGYTGSNSLYFEERGWIGICVEADPRHIDSLSRRHCQVFLAAIDQKEELRKFHLSDYCGLSGLNISTEYQSRDIWVQTVRLERILEQVGVTEVDLLSIDTESTEIDVLESLNINRFRPKIVIAEHDTMGRSTRANLIEWFWNHPYRMAHETVGNLIFVRDDVMPAKRPRYL